MLEGKRVKLGPIKKEYIDSFLRWFNDPEIIQYLASYLPMTRMAEEAWMENLKDGDDTIRFSIVIPQEDGSEKLIGNCGIHNINWKNRVAEVGIVIGEKDYQNKGFGTEAMELLLEYAFNTINLHRIELFTYEYNIGALKSYNKVGFVEEGRRRQFMYFKGKYHDTILMGILAEEWNAKTEK